MIDQLQYFPVNWIDGMKINKNNFIALQNFIYDSIKDTVGMRTSMINYGLLPSDNSVQLSLIVDNHRILRVKVEECHAITPNGSRIDINRQRNEGLELSIPYPEASYEIEEDQQSILFACLSVNYFQQLPYGEPDPHENPPRYPFTQPSYHLHLVPENELKRSGFGHNYITIGKIIVLPQDSRIDDYYIPPSVNITSHKKLRELYTEIDRFYGQMEIYGSQVVQKILVKRQNNALAVLIRELSDMILQFLASEINQYRWIYPHENPSHMLLSVTRLARILKNFIDARTGAGKEEMFTYFSEWCNHSPGDFESIFSELINSEYHHNHIDKTVTKVIRFKETLEELYAILNKLDYIGKKRDGSIFVSELTDERDQLLNAKRSRTFLAD